MLKGMEQLIRQENMLPRGSRVLCAVSGGADSVLLLCFLNEYKKKSNTDFPILAALHHIHNQYYM